MIKNLLLVVAFVWLATLSLIVWKALSDESNPPRLEQFSSVSDGGERVYRVSLAVLAQDPSAIDGDFIDSRGYLAVDDGILSLYPSRADFQSGDRSLALQVRGPADFQEKILEEFRNKYVVFYGRVVASDKDARHKQFMGALFEAKGFREAIVPDERSPAELDFMVGDLPSSQ
jgi:hypothetical protein